jgi:glycosyltransferase involved in cell wall biosynthesis/GT2 family glycosyltransferase
MKILLTSTSDLHGGAAIASYRLFNALHTQGEKVKMLVRDKFSNNPLVVSVGNRCENKWNFYRERGEIFLYNRLSKKYLFDVSIASTGISIVDLPEFREADIIHLHWVNQGMLSVNEISNIIASGKKIVWTMHDMWSFTGICHHASDCCRYEQPCGFCPYLVVNSQNDLSNTVFRKKQKAYSQGNITFVACSEWLKNLAEKSPLTNNQSVVSIPNPIDTQMYRPKDKTQTRHQLNLPIDKKIILFAAVKASDRRKGMDYLIKASRLLQSKNDDLLFLIVGNEGEEIEKQLALPTINAGYISPEKMPDFYNAADVFVTPSLQENLPNTIMEAMSCGTPCVGFNIGGISEMIDHQKTGYVAEYKNAKDLAKGIYWTLFEADNETLCANARKKVLLEYSQEIIAKKYIELYKSAPPQPSPQGRESLPLEGELEGAKLSIITVTYNAEHTIQRTLESVHTQSYPHIEHIIVDGASKDNTLSLIQNSKFKIQNFFCVSERDKGIYDAMNKAVTMATGDYLCFLNAGDAFFASNTVEKMMQSFDENTSPDILYGETAIVDDNGKFLYMRRLKTPEILTWKSFRQGMLVCHQAFIVKRELFEPYNLSYRFSSDFDWCIRMMEKTNRIHNTHLTLINYLNEGMTTANRKSSLKERYRIMTKYYGAISTFFYHIWFVVRAIVIPEKNGEN